MRHRFTIKELEELSDLEIFRILCWERQSTCTNIQAPIYKKMDRLIESLDYWIKEKRKKDAEPEDTNFHITILHHDISYFFRDTDLEIEEEDCDYEHISNMIGEGYSQGELNKTDPTDPDNCFPGWWSINKEN